MKITSRSPIDEPPSRVMEVLASETFIVASETARGALSCRYEEVEDGEDRRVFDVTTTEYKHGMTGVDRSQTEEATTRYTWERAAHVARWVYQPAHFAERFRIAGVYRAVPAGGGCELHSEVEIDVEIPLMGKRIAKMIAKEFEAATPRFVEILRKHLV